MELPEKKRVAVIGPLLPYRGGIAQHTTLLSRALGDITETLTISFSRQYPSWLFPGESDTDPKYKDHREPGCEYLLDSMNPLSWSRVVERVDAFAADIVVIPWWTVFWTPCFGYISRALRERNLEVVFFCHNVIEHESSGWKSYLTRLVLKKGTRFVAHTRADQKNLHSLVPGAAITVHPHPIYDQFPEPLGSLPRRKSLELLFYGFVRPYKGLDTLIEALGKIAQRDVMLTIAGEFWEGKQALVDRIEQLGISDLIEMRAYYHSEQDTAELFSRADMVVLPYRSATGSGVIMLAYNYNRPVLVTSVGGLADVVEQGRTGFVVPPEDPEAIAGLLRTLRPEDCEAMQPCIEETKRRWTWSGLAEALLDAG
ncbi:MAG: glycosyltransferase [Gammaproteobacteria bacterium]|nr:glycosyltransferase [Gammaproteobacteria bacterium]